MLGVTWTDITVQAAAVVASLLLTVVLYRGLVALSFDERKAQLLGLRPTLVRLALLALIALTVVTSFKTVGALLVFGLIIAPAATAILVANRIPALMATSALLGVVSVVGGLLMSFHLDIAAGAAMVAASVAIFFLVLATREAANAWRLHARRRLA